MLASSCPSSEQLRDFAIGLMDEPEAQAIVDHLDGCAACEQTIDHLELSADTVISAIRQPRVADPYAEEPGCRRAQSLVERLGEELSGKVAKSRPQTPESLPIEQMGPYRLLERIGAGGMGTVYKAVHTKLEKVVALKILPAERTRVPSAVARFEREMRAVGKLDHPHIVRATDAGEIDGTHFLVMELVDGFDLSTVLNCCGPLSIPNACEVIHQAAAGLQEAHRHGMVHRDIKPSNLMLARSAREGESPTVKILDLGLARLAAESASAAGDLTGEHHVVGTLNYMAPEQLTNTPGVDIRADIYSLGATLYKLLTGELPFVAPRHQVFLARNSMPSPDDIKPIESLRTDVPAGLSAVVRRMLAADPAMRYGSPQEVADALQEYRVGHDLNRLWPDGVRSSSLDLRPARPLHLGQPTRTDGPLARPRPRLGFWGIGAVGFLSLGGVVASQWLRPEKTDSVTEALVKANASLAPTDSVPIVDGPSDDIELSIAERNRRAVDWALGLGGKVTVTSNGLTNILHPGEDLPFNNYQLVIDLNRNPHVDNAGLDNLRGATAIRGLILNGTPVSTLEPVLTLPNLNWINCSIDVLDADDIRSLASLSALRRISLGNFASTPPPQEKADEIFAAACQLRQLEKLDFGSFYYSLGDEALAELRHMPQLQSLALRSKTLTDRGILNLPPLPELTWLVLSCRKVTAAGLIHLDRYPKLEVLNLELLVVKDDDIRKWPDLPHLYSMALNECRGLTGSGLIRWKVWPRIKWFRTVQMPLTDGDLEAMASVNTRLEYLAVIDSPRLTPAAVESFARMKRLKNLNLTGCTQFTDDSIPALSQLTGLSLLHVARTGLSPDGVARLRQALPTTSVRVD